MGAAPEETPDGTGVLVADTVFTQMNALPGPIQEIVARTILSVGTASGAVPVDLTVPDSPPGAQYMALSTPDPDAPVIIYREITSDEQGLEGRWLVTTLLAPAVFRQYRRAGRMVYFPDTSTLVNLSKAEPAELNDVALRAIGEP
jgi:hypothetical protein